MVLARAFQLQVIYEQGLVLFYPYPRAATILLILPFESPLQTLFAVTTLAPHTSNITGRHPHRRRYDKHDQLSGP